MESDQTVRLREDIYDLQIAYDTATTDSKEELKRKKLSLQKVLWAFHQIQRLDPKDRNSFFRIAGYHGMPFRGAGWGNASWWGGYCNHGNVLFPTWHRAYLVRLEKALRSVEGCEDVALPYWNETGDATVANGIPSIFLRPRVKIPRWLAKEHADSEKEELEISNPLRSYKFQAGVWDNLAPLSDANCSKPRGYETKRYPFSGLVSSEELGKTTQHNKLMYMLDTDRLLNENVKTWLGESSILCPGKVLEANTRYKYEQCLNAPSYTVFSNTTSATQYNQDIYYNAEENDVEIVPSKRPKLPIVSLESPHNDIHLAIGGISFQGQGSVGPIIGASGDMGENETASFDPIFFFHHCFIDKVFWDWQRKWDATLKSRTELAVEPGYPGTNSVDYQGPTPGVTGNTWLTMASPLAPFTKDDEPDGAPLTSNDVVDIVTQLGYKYYRCDDKKPKMGEPPCGDKTCGRCSPGNDGDDGRGPSDASRPASPAQGPTSTATPSSPPPPVRIVRVDGLNRAAVAGSFALVVRAAAAADGRGERVVGTEAVLSRWTAAGCANCRNHLGVTAFLPLVGLDAAALATVRVGLAGRRGLEVDDLNAADGRVRGRWRLLGGGRVEGTTARGAGVGISPRALDLPLRNGSAEESAAAPRAAAAVPSVTEESTEESTEKSPAPPGEPAAVLSVTVTEESTEETPAAPGAPAVVSSVVEESTEKSPAPPGEPAAVLSVTDESTEETPAAPGTPAAVPPASKESGCVGLNRKTCRDRMCSTVLRCEDGRRRRERTKLVSPSDDIVLPLRPSEAVVP